MSSLCILRVRIYIYIYIYTGYIQNVEKDTVIHVFVIAGKGIHFYSFIIFPFYHLLHLHVMFLCPLLSHNKGLMTRPDLSPQIMVSLCYQVRTSRIEGTRFIPSAPRCGHAVTMIHQESVTPHPDPPASPHTSRPPCRGR